MQGRAQERSPQSGPQSRTAAIAEGVSECFNVFPTYGANLTESLGVFGRVLAPYESDRVKAAFRIWIEGQNAMPTPADIKKIIAPPRPTDKGEEKPYVNDWKQMSLEDRAAFSSLMQRTYAALESGDYEIKPPPHAVPWYGKKWKDMSENLKAQINLHLQRMIAEDPNGGRGRAQGYLLYLRQFRGFPASFGQRFEGEQV